MEQKTATRYPTVGVALVEVEPAPVRLTPADPSVEVIYGAGIHYLPLAGLTVGQAYELAGTILRVKRPSPVLLNGRPARMSEPLTRGDTLEFVHHAGEKGAVDGPGH
jgi:hypothetical protein